MEHPLDNPEADCAKSQTLTVSLQNWIERDCNGGRRERCDETDKHAYCHLAFVRSDLGEIVRTVKRSQEGDAKEACGCRDNKECSRDPRDGSVCAHHVRPP